MGCVLALLATISPRLVLVLAWIFTNLVDRAFTGFLLPLLGLIVLPFTTLLYVLAYRPVVGVSGWGWFLVFLGLLFDLGSYSGGRSAAAGAELRAPAASHDANRDRLPLGAGSALRPMARAHPVTKHLRRPLPITTSRTTGAPARG